LPGSNQIEISELTASSAHGSHPGRLRVSAIRSCRRISIAGRFPISLHQRDKSPPGSSRAMRPADSTVIGRWLGSKRLSDPNAAPLLGQPSHSSGLTKRSRNRKRTACKYRIYYADSDMLH
jgi:hypothetical protein